MGTASADPLEQLWDLARRADRLAASVHPDVERRRLQRQADDFYRRARQLCWLRHGKLFSLSPHK